MTALHKAISKLLPTLQHQHLLIWVMQILGWSNWQSIWIPKTCTPLPCQKKNFINQQLVFADHSSFNKGTKTTFDTARKDALSKCINLLSSAQVVSCPIIWITAQSLIAAAFTAPQTGEESVYKWLLTRAELSRSLELSICCADRLKDKTGII